LAAYRLWKREEPPVNTALNYLEFAGEPGSRRWSEAAESVSLPIEEVSFLGNTVFEHTVIRGGRVVINAAPVPRPPGKSFIVSMWIKLPVAFQGGEPRPHVMDSTTMAEQDRRPEPRGEWQYIWRAVAAAGHSSELLCELHLDAAAGDVFQTAGWCLEAGHRPSGWGVQVEARKHE
jgi:hypothetical protein